MRFSDETLEALRDMVTADRVLAQKVRDAATAQTATAMLVEAAKQRNIPLRFEAANGALSDEHLEGVAGGLNPIKYGFPPDFEWPAMPALLPKHLQEVPLAEAWGR